MSWAFKKGEMPISPLTGTLNRPVNSLMKESRGVNKLQLLQAAGIFCPFPLAHPSIPDPRRGFLQQMALLVSLCGDKETTTGGPDSNHSTSPHLPQKRFTIMPRAARIRAQKRCHVQVVQVTLVCLCAVPGQAGICCPVWDADLPDGVSNWRRSKGNRQQ